MDFEQAREYLLSTVSETRSGRHPNRLDRMRALLDALGNPQDRYPTIHVGGTSGKGSTSTMIAAALSAAGKRVGLHTKPHLRSIVERARIDGVPVTEDVFARLFSEMFPVLERVAALYERPSYYETLLALAFLYFAWESVDVAVIEVGVGGKLDGTNVIVPEVSIITNVGLDHTDILGDTVEEIAADKAGIAKAGIPLVSAAEHPGARAIIEEACARAGAPFISVLDTTTVVSETSPPLMQRFDVRTPQDCYRLTLPVLGLFQQRNAATAIVALEQLRAELRPARSQVEEAFAQLHIPGRMEYFPSHPPLIFDIAHNPDKARHLADSLRYAFAGRRFTFVLAIGQSKDAAEILAVLRDLPAMFIFTSFETEGRTAMRPQRLASIAESLQLWGRAVGDPVEALSIARRNAAADDVIVVTGSTFVVAQLRKWWLENVVASGSAP